MVDTPSIDASSLCESTHSAMSRARSGGRSSLPDACPRPLLVAPSRSTSNREQRAHAQAKRRVCLSQPLGPLGRRQRGAAKALMDPPEKMGWGLRVDGIQMHRLRNVCPGHRNTLPGFVGGPWPPSKHLGTPGTLQNLRAAGGPKYPTDSRGTGAKPCIGGYVVATQPKSEKGLLQF